MSFGGIVGGSGNANEQQQRGGANNNLSAPAFQFQLPPWGEPHAGLPPPPASVQDLPAPGAGGFVCLLACDATVTSLPKFDERANAAAVAAHASKAAAANAAAKAADNASTRRSSTRISSNQAYLDLSKATTAQIAAFVAASAPKTGATGEEASSAVPAPDVPWSRQGLPTGAAPRRKPVASGWSGSGGGGGGSGGGGGGGGGGGRVGRPSNAAAMAAAALGAAGASARPSSRPSRSGGGGGSFPVGVRQPQADAMLRDHLMGKSFRAPWREMGAPRRPVIG